MSDPSPPVSAVEQAAQRFADGSLRILDLHEVGPEHCPVCIEVRSGGDACPVHVEPAPGAP